MEVQPHEFLELDTRCWVVSFTSRPLYPQGKSSWYPMDRRLGGRWWREKFPAPAGTRTHRLYSPTLYYWPIRVAFMVWYLVKYRHNFTFTYYFTSFHRRPLNGGWPPMNTKVCFHVSTRAFRGLPDTELIKCCRTRGPTVLSAALEPTQYFTSYTLFSATLSHNTMMS